MTEEKTKTPEKHIKPTPEELEENIKKTEEELEALKNNPEPAPSESPEPTPATPPSEPVSSPEVSPEVPEEPSEPIPSPQIDYKKKFIESSREAQVLHAKNKKINEALDKASQIPEPTEEELMAEYQDWEMMSDTEKKLARQTLMANRRLTSFDEATKEFKDIEKWQEKVDAFLGNPEMMTKYPDLEGREDEFSLFATKPTRRGVDFEDLIPAFLYMMKPDYY